MNEYRFFVEQCEDSEDRYKESREGRDDVIDELQKLSELHAFVLEEIPRRIELIMEETKQPDEAKVAEADEQSKKWCEDFDVLITWVSNAEMRLAKEQFTVSDDLEVGTENQKVSS